MATLNSLAGALQITTSNAARLLEELEESELLTFEGGDLRLKPAGREMGLHVVRAAPSLGELPRRANWRARD